MLRLNMPQVLRTGTAPPNDNGWARHPTLLHPPSMIDTRALTAILLLHHPPPHTASHTPIPTTRVTPTRVQHPKAQDDPSTQSSAKSTRSSNETSLTAAPQHHHHPATETETETEIETGTTTETPPDASQTDIAEAEAEAVQTGITMTEVVAAGP